MIAEILINAIEGLERELEKAYRRLFHHYPHHPRCRHRNKVRQVIFVIINKQKYISMEPINLKVEDGAAGVVSGLVDSKTLQPIAGAVATPVSKTSDNEAVLSIDAQGNTVPVASGTANVTVVNDWAYTDPEEGPLTGIRLTTIQPYVVVEKEGVLQVISAGPAVVAPPPAQA
jgi:hypothetical protein